MKKLYFLVYSILIVTQFSCQKEYITSVEKSLNSKMNPNSIINLASYDIPIISVAVSSTSPSLSPPSALYDKNDATVWSSSVHSDVNSTEWL